MSVQLLFVEILVVVTQTEGRSETVIMSTMCGGGNDYKLKSELNMNAGGHVHRLLCAREITI